MTSITLSMCMYVIIIYIYIYIIIHTSYKGSDTKIVEDHPLLESCLPYIVGTSTQDM